MSYEPREWTEATQKSISHKNRHKSWEPVVRTSFELGPRRLHPACFSFFLLPKDRFLINTRALVCASVLRPHAISTLHSSIPHQRNQSCGGGAREGSRAPRGMPCTSRGCDQSARRIHGVGQGPCRRMPVHREELHGTRVSYENGPRGR